MKKLALSISTFATILLAEPMGLCVNSLGEICMTFSDSKIAEIKSYYGSVEDYNKKEFQGSGKILTSKSQMGKYFGKCVKKDGIVLHFMGTSDNGWDYKMLCEDINNGKYSTN